MADSRSTRLYDVQLRAQRIFDDAHRVVFNAANVLVLALIVSGVLCGIGWLIATALGVGGT